MPILINHQPAESLSVTDRGFTYGDGVFRTLRASHGQPRLWRWQWQQLAHDCAALGLPLPDVDPLLADITRVCAGIDEATVRITVTRGHGARGYSPASAPGSTLIVQASPYLAAPDSCFRDGIVARLCDWRLALQPRLAGIKHLNRLEQVLARAEWQDPVIFDGLMRDTAGRVVCATAANVFVLIDGVWRTPSLDQCGVAGIARGWLLANVPDIEVTVLGPETVESAQAVFLCNAVRGILPVGRLGTREWRPHARTTDLRRRLAAAQPAFAFQE